MGYVDTTERVGDLIVQVVADEDGGGSNPRDNSNLSHIYGDHPHYVIGDGKPPSDEADALDRGGIRLLARYLRMSKGAVAMTGLGMYDHSGVSYYPVKIGERFTHPFDSGRWDSSNVGYAYVTRDDLAEMGTAEADAEAAMLSEIAEYDSWARGDVWGYVVTKPCDHADEHDSDAEIADCPHSETLDSCWGYIGESEYALSEGKSSAEWHNANPAVPA